MAMHQLTQLMSALGRNGDNMVGHLTYGDVVIPHDVALEHPEFLTKFKKVMEDRDQDYRTHVAGSGYENKNPHTGASEFFSLGHALSSLWHGATSTLAPTIGKGIISGGFNPMNTLSSILGTGQATAGSNNSAPSAAASTPAPSLGSASQTFTPKQPAAMPLPFDLGMSSAGGQQFSTLDPMQQRSYLATQGSQGSGIGGDAKNYYLNLLQRNLVDDSGNMQNMNTALLPIEHNYLSRLGLPTDNTSSFLQALQS